MNNLTNGDALTLALALFSVGICIYCLFVARQAVADARRAVLDAARPHDLADLAQEALERVSDLEASVRRLHSRAGMREVRERRKNGIPDDRPDPESQPEAWRAWAAKQRGLK